MVEPDRYLLRPSPELERLFAELNELAARADWPGALQAAEGMLGLAPDAVPPRLLAAQVLLRLDRYREARALVAEAASNPIDPPNMLLQALRLLRRFEMPEAMAFLFANSDWRQIRDVGQLCELAPMFLTAGMYDQASACLDAAIELAPDDPDVHCLRGMLEMVLGNAGASLRALRQALQREPRLAMAHGLVAMQDDKSNAEEHIHRMRAVQGSIVPYSEGEAQLCYALHKRLDAVGQYEEAWAALERGHAVMRHRVRYDREETMRTFDALEGLDLPVAIPGDSASPATGPIFIVGMYRSGTTLIERVLAGHPQVQDGGESFQLTAAMREAVDHDTRLVVDRTVVARAGQGDYELVRNRMRDYAAWYAGGRRWLTEKLPANFLNIGFILHALPHARIVHLMRDPVQTCFSNLRTLFRDTAPYATDQLALAEYFLRYRRLMAHWHALAPERILDMDYAAFVVEPEAQARRLLEYCGLEYDPAVIDLERRGGAAATASASEVRRGILTDRAGIWKPYAPKLQPMLEVLASGE